MNYCEYVKNNQELLGERLELVMERVAEIAKSPELGGELGTYFAEVANLLLLQKEILDMAESCVLAQMNE